MNLAFDLPVKTTNPLNGSQGFTRGAVYAQAATRKRHRQAALIATTAAWRSAGSPVLPIPLVCTLTRLSAGTLDGDGLQAACKALRDGIADALGINDGSNNVWWKYEQQKCKRGEYGVRVRLEALL